MAYTTIDDPSAYFQTKTYTGNGSTQDITFDGNSNLQPDWLWLKGRSLAEGHTLQNSVTGVTKHLHTNNTDAQVTDTGIVTAFNSDGFSLGDEGDVNGNSSTFVGWGWKKQAGLFDIVTYTGNGSNRTISHNLGVAPTMMIIKNIESGGTNWFVYHVGIGNAAKYVKLNQTNAESTKASLFNSTAPTSSVFSLGTDNDGNESGQDFIAYLFGNTQGVSNCGSYTGNGNADGTFIFTSFKPAFVMLKKTSGTGNWQMFDNKRVGYNPDNDVLRANLSNAECTSCVEIDILSNGFKLINTDGDGNTSGGTYIYMAFAENPFVASSFAATTAR